LYAADMRRHRYLPSGALAKEKAEEKEKDKEPTSSSSAIQSAPIQQRCTCWTIVRNALTDFDVPRQPCCLSSTLCL